MAGRAVALPSPDRDGRHERPSPGRRRASVYEPADPQDGYRVLVDRIWPRGLTKVDAAVDHLLDLAEPRLTLVTSTREVAISNAHVLAERLSAGRPA